jgi:hypothetical protein
MTIQNKKLRETTNNNGIIGVNFVKGGELRKDMKTSRDLK